MPPAKQNNSNPLRIIFAGTPEFAACALRALIHHAAASNTQVVAVYSQPDRPAGRGRQLTASPVKEVALAQAIPVYQPDNFKHSDALEQLQQLNADLMVVAAYGIILPLSVLNIPRLGCINIHASLLPRWRGAAPIQRAIAAGDTETGITIMQMDEGLDSGDMLLCKKCPIEANDTGSSLHDKLALLGASSLLEAIELIQQNKIKAIPQNNKRACYAHKLNKQEAFINWQQSAAAIERQIRAFNSWPVAQSYFENKVIRLWQAKIQMPLPNTGVNSKPGEIVAVNKDSIIVACAQGYLAITEIQLAGAKRMTVQALLNGRPALFKTGQCFNREK